MKKGTKCFETWWLNVWLESDKSVLLKTKHTSSSNLTNQSLEVSQMDTGQLYCSTVC